MAIGLILIPTVFVIILFVFYGMYVTLIKKRNMVLEALSSVDVQLQKRFDLIPNILTIAQKYMDFEKTILAEITALRQQFQGGINNKDAGAAAEHLGVATTLQGKMGSFFALAENYPDLKASQPMMQAMQTYENTEDSIAATRRFYNSAVGSLNNSVQIFPSSVIASMIGIGSYPFFEGSEGIEKAINASDYLK
jgi:LemA protein